MAAQINGSVVKAFEILRLFTPDRPVIAAADLVRELGLGGVTAHRFLKTLEQVGALVAESRGQYRLSFVFADLASRLMDGQMLARLAQPVLTALSADLDEASMATVFRSDRVVVIARAASRRPLMVDVRVGAELEAWCTAHGKLWLAHLGEDELARYLERIPRHRFTETTVIDEAGLRSELARIRAEGVSENRGEREEGLGAVAVPVRTRAGRLVTTLSVFGPAARVASDGRTRILPRLIRAAAALEQALYGPVEAR